MRKTVLGIAGIAVALTLIGGATFAGWTDFYNVDATTKAGKLELTVSPGGAGVGTSFDNVNFAPGQAIERVAHVLSNAGDSVPSGALTVTLENLVGTENGCDSNGEATDEAGADTLKTDPAALCAQGLAVSGPPVIPATNQGQFIEQAEITIRQWDVTVAMPCNKDSASQAGANLILPYTKLDQVAAGAIAIKNLNPGEGTCVFVALRLPNNASVDNASQGDTADFDLRYVLTQI